jgi:hypothetical protein
MVSESIRLQLAGTSVKITELVPPSVRTALLPGQETNQTAMPLDEFVSEVIALLEAEPDAEEILVERVKFLRYGEVRGDYGFRESRGENPPGHSPGHARHIESKPHQVILRQAGHDQNPR